MSRRLTTTEKMMNQFHEERKIIERKGINSKWLLIILGVGLVCNVIGVFDEYITCIIAITLPVYWSIKAIETSEKDDDKQWLTYWTVFAFFSFFDLFSKSILKWFRFYFVIKYVFLIWCFMPNTKGALFIYKHLLVKIFKKIGMKIEQNINEQK